MQSETNKIFEDLTRLMNSMSGTLTGASREAERRLRNKLREVAADGDAIDRDEFEAVKAMAAAARDENDALKARVAALEVKLGAQAAPKPATKRKPGA